MQSVEAGRRGLKDLNFETLERLDDQSIRRLKRSTIGLPSIMPSTTQYIAGTGTLYSKNESENPLNLTVNNRSPQRGFQFSESTGQINGDLDEGK
jgi:hypothetical protein